IKPDAWISSGTKFLGKIGDPCTDLTFIPALSNAAFDMGSGLNRSANNAPKEDSGEKALFSIYPNPTSGIFSIQSLNSKKIKHAIISKIEASSITFEEFYDYQKTIDIDISKEKSGLYIVEVFFEDNTSQTKTLIKK
ncbi:MAG TPA: T9SS type A sorting domain-containing protein, partial [Flavobacterium sp.]|nr:T9SS type A sorting domain-containing protein [Flavobacterium sp.]